MTSEPAGGARACARDVPIARSGQPTCQAAPRGEHPRPELPPPWISPGGVANTPHRAPSMCVTSRPARRCHAVGTRTRHRRCSERTSSSITNSDGATMTPHLDDPSTLGSYARKRLGQPDHPPIALSRVRYLPHGGEPSPPRDRNPVTVQCRDADSLMRATGHLLGTRGVDGVPGPLIVVNQCGAGLAGSGPSYVRNPELPAIPGGPGHPPQTVLGRGRRNVSIAANPRWRSPGRCSTV
jgi:hypothetical protein